MKRFVARAGLAAALALTVASVPMLSGCGSTVASEGETTATVVTSSGSPVSQSASSMDFSEGIDENGMWEGVRALDYVELCADYDAVVIPADVLALEVEQRVQSQIDTFVEHFSQVEQVTDRAVADGDTVNIDYVGSIDGVEFEGGSTGGAGTLVTIGVTQYIDDFLEQLVGHEPGETFDVEVTFPEDYHAAELAGKDAVFVVTVNHIEETIVPEVTDEWVAQNLSSAYGWTTVDQMMEQMNADFTADAKMTYAQNYVVENSVVSEIPQVVMDYQERFLVYQMQSYASSYGFAFEDFISMVYGVSTAEELIEQNRSAVEDLARGYLVFQAIAEQEGLSVSDEDVKLHWQQAMGVEDITSYVDTYGMPHLKLNTLCDTVIALCAERAIVE